MIGLLNTRATRHKYCKVELRDGAESARSLCFGPMSYATVRACHAWETGLSNKPFCTQVNDAWAKYLVNYSPESRLRNQPFTLILKHQKVD